MSRSDRNAVYAQHTIQGAARRTRLLRLQPGRFTEQIQCSLMVHHLTDAEARHKYEALSYTWGSYSETRSVSIEDVTFQVTNNLFSALQRLRLSTSERVLWVDALCINQDDTNERGQQVAIMDSIYKQAEKVLVWLGDATVGKANTTKHHEWDETCQAKFVAAIENTTPSWWQRAWTMQEYMLAKEQPLLCFGDCSHKVAEYFDYRSNSCPTMQFMPFGNVTSALSVLEEAREDVAASKARPRLIDLLQNLSKHTATDPRDYIYCLLGLMSEGEASLIRPDYTVESEIVFARATYVAIAVNNSLEIMKRAGQTAMVSKLPSWAMNPTPGQETLRGSWGYPRVWPDEHSRHSWSLDPISGQLQASLDQSSVKLTLRVYILDSVRRLLFRRFEGKDHIYGPAHVALSADSRWNNLGDQHQGWSARDSWRHHITDAGGRLFDRWPSTSIKTQSDHGGAAAYWEDESGIMHNHGLVLLDTYKSYFGVVVGPTTIQENDVVALPHGCPFPMLLRPRQQEYIFVSFIHIHGIMQGELCDAENDFNLESRSIVLV